MTNIDSQNNAPKTAPQSTPIENDRNKIIFQPILLGLLFIALIGLLYVFFGKATKDKEYKRSEPIEVPTEPQQDIVTEVKETPPQDEELTIESESETDEDINADQSLKNAQIFEKERLYRWAAQCYQKAQNNQKAQECESNYQKLLEEQNAYLFRRKNMKGLEENHGLKTVTKKNMYGYGRVSLYPHNIVQIYDHLQKDYSNEMGLAKNKTLIIPAVFTDIRIVENSLLEANISTANTPFWLKIDQNGNCLDCWETDLEGVKLRYQ